MELQLGTQDGATSDQVIASKWFVCFAAHERSYRPNPPPSEGESEYWIPGGYSLVFEDILQSTLSAEQAASGFGQMILTFGVSCTNDTTLVCADILGCTEDEAFSAADRMPEVDRILEYMLASKDSREIAPDQNDKRVARTTAFTDRG